MCFYIRHADSSVYVIARAAIHVASVYPRDQLAFRYPLPWEAQGLEDMRAWKCAFVLFFSAVLSHGLEGGVDGPRTNVPDPAQYGVIVLRRTGAVHACQCMLRHVETTFDYTSSGAVIAYAILVIFGTRVIA